jgi:hypothetical protein
LLIENNKVMSDKSVVTMIHERATRVAADESLVLSALASQQALALFARALFERALLTQLQLV